jgi:hypothetical protein
MNKKMVKNIEHKLNTSKEILAPKELHEILNLREEIEALKHPRTSSNGETEYHTSYGWFTKEQITYIQNSNVNDYL